MPIYTRKLANGTQVFDVVVSQGRKTIWRRGFRSEPAAKKVETALEADRDKGINISPSNFTVGQYLTKWLDDYASTLEPSTYQTYKTNLNIHVIPVIGDKKLKSLAAHEVQDCYSLITRKRSGKTALNVHRVLREAIQHAVRLEYVHRNVCDSVTPPRAVKYQVAPPTQKGLNALLEITDKTQYAVIVRTALWTGLRQSELINLKWADVDLEAKVLYVRKAKWGSAGAVVLSEEIIEVLKAHRAKQNELKLKLGPAIPAHDYVFTNSIGKQVDAGGLKRTWRTVKAKTGLRFHDLRHAHASLLIAAGVHLSVIKERLRHRNISTTADIYGHLMAGLQEQAAQSIDAALVRPKEERAR